MTHRLHLRDINEYVAKQAADQLTATVNALKEELKAELTKVIREQIEENQQLARHFEEEVVLEICDNCGAEVNEEGNCECPSTPPQEDLLDSDYHHLTQCFTGEFTGNYPEDTDYTHAYTACQMKENGGKICDQAFRDARDRFYVYQAKLTQEEKAPEPTSYFHLLKNKLIDVSGFKQKIEALVPALQKAELYMHGSDLKLFKEAMKELNNIIH